MCASGSRANSTRHRAAPYPTRKSPDTVIRGRGRREYHHSTAKRTSPSRGRLVELARMTRLGTGAGKDHRPRKVRRLAPELAVDEVRDAAEPEPGRYERNEEVGHHEEPEPVPAGKPRRGRDHPEEPSVEGHPSLPDPQDDEGIGDETREVVEQHVADASPPAPRRGRGRTRCRRRAAGSIPATGPAPRGAGRATTRARCRRCRRCRTSGSPPARWILRQGRSRES